MFKKNIVCLLILIITTFVVYPQSGTISLPDTGQITSYATGDDGELQEGVNWHSPRFTDNSDGTITESLTGLMWVRVFATIERSWQGALDYCNNLTLAGYTDWRLPNIDELESLLNKGVSISTH